MEYTGQNIEDYIYNRLKALKLPIKGKMYKKGTRPIDSQNEDCVVSFLSGTAEQIQQGFVVVNVFVKDILGGDGLYYRDIKRCATIENVLAGIVDKLNENGDLYLTKDGMVVTLQEENINQHFVSLKLKFKVLNS